MATLSAFGEPTHVGDFALPCPLCDLVLSVPVFVEVVDAEPEGKRSAVRLALRTSVGADVIGDHVREHEGRRLSRPARR